MLQLFGRPGRVNGMNPHRVVIAFRPGFVSPEFSLQQDLRGEPLQNLPGVFHATQRGLSQPVHGFWDIRGDALTSGILLAESILRVMVSPSPASRRVESSSFERTNLNCSQNCNCQGAIQGTRRNIKTAKAVHLPHYAPVCDALEQI